MIPSIILIDCTYKYNNVLMVRLVGSFEFEIEGECCVVSQCRSISD